MLDQINPSGPSEEEEWRPIQGFEGVYSVSNLGRVRRDKGGRGAVAGRILRPGTDTNGYLFVVLHDGGTDHRQVAILVTTAFHGPKPPGHEVNHKDANKDNNNADNLEWMTGLQNAAHAHALGLIPDPKGELNGRAKLTEADVLLIRASSSNGAELGRRYGVTRQTIYAIRHGIHWQHI